MGQTALQKKTTIVLDTHKLKLVALGVLPKAMLILDKAAFDVEGIAKTLATVLTGAMRASIYVSGASGGSNYRARLSEATSKASSKGVSVDFHKEVKPDGKMERIVGVGVVYGIFPELNGKPYIVPAVEQVRPGFNKAWKALFV